MSEDLRGLIIHGEGARLSFPAIGVRLVCLLILLSCTGCSYTSIRYIDNEGRGRIIGLVSVKYTPSNGTNDLSVSEIGGTDLEIKTIGISYLSSPAGSGLSLGYSGERVLMLEDNAVVGNPPKSKTEEEDSYEN